MRLLLFDIDGTLIQADRAGRLAMRAALEEVYGTYGTLDTYDMGGKTDLRIVMDVLGQSGVAQEVVQRSIPDLFEVMAGHAQLIFPLRNIRPCSGVLELLAALRRTDGVMLGLLTGNARQTAALKLEAAGIDPAQFCLGAYGSDHWNRDELPAIALRRANSLTDVAITGDNAVIIGDTPADVQCARAGVTTAVAVASGWHDAGALALHEPDFLFTDFSDTAGVLTALLGQQGSGYGG